MTLFLAPMAGFTDIAFRDICRNFGADVVETEFVQSEALVRDRERTWKMIEYSREQRPVGVQIFGAVPESMAKAASLVAERLNPDFIDLNFGCPAPKVVGTNAGSGLLKDLPLLEKVASAVVKAVPEMPVTAKIRLGWDREHLVHLEVAKRLEDAGVRRITVHGRTRAQGYSGNADWDAIAQVVQTVSVPVIGNGDIKDAGTARRRADESGVAGLMIGRGALGRPWIFREIKAALAGTPIPPEPDFKSVLKILIAYAEAICGDAEYGLRANIGRLLPFIRGVPGSRPLRAQVAQAKTLGEFKNILEKSIDSKEDFCDNNFQR
ncbi:MAG: tRNA dihydrouridine synthase DusB [Opitutales bacterium]|nr:tRNA dihydrouridine synthase DusB [Opitutales bacterium]